MWFYVPKNSSHVMIFGKDFNADSVQSWFRRNWYLAYSFALLYIGSIYITQQIMRTRKEFELKVPLTIWNMCLASFSIYTTYKTWTRYYPFIKEHGWVKFLCDATPTRREAELVSISVLFLISKFVEFGDTLFIVLRKRKLIFLHWYHHATVAIVAWEFELDYSSFAQFSVSLNAFVHSWMYSYFALKCMGYKIPKFASMMLTIIQILQIFTGVSLVAWIANKKRHGLQCEISERLYKVCVAVGVTYLFLFIKFFRDAYMTPISDTHKIRTKSD